MTKRDGRDRAGESSIDSRHGYSPRLRTALVLSGTGTAGAYHAGVLRALDEAGVKIDLVAGRGIGVAGAMFAAVDGAARLWDAAGLWRHRSTRRFYAWRPALQIVVCAFAAAIAVLIVPLAVLAAGLAVYVFGFLFRIAGLEAGRALATSYAQMIQRAFEPDMLPTLLPRVSVLLLVLMVAVFGWAAMLARAPRRGRRHERGWLWDVVGAPWDLSPVAAMFRGGLWRLIHGAGGLREPGLRDMSRRYGELLADNLGQPGFRELLVTVHDLDARRDLVFALLKEPHRNLFFRSGGPDGERRADSHDLSGVGRDHILAALTGSLSVPVLTEPHLMTHSTEGFWRGETHRLCDRPGATSRLIQEIAAAGVDQVVFVFPGASLPGPHGLTARRSDVRARVSDSIGAADVSAARDAVHEADRLFKSVFVIAPSHSAIGPFDFAGVYDERSDRRQAMTELIDRGYEDAYRQFIEPVVGASGDRLDVAPEPRAARLL